MAVVVNADSWASQTIANHYVHLRQIPRPTSSTSKVCRVSSRRTWRRSASKILVPVFKTLFERNLLEHIDYIIYSSDFPTAIDVRKDLGERNRRSTWLRPHRSPA